MSKTVPYSSPVSKYDGWCRTDLKNTNYEYSFLWTIENFSSHSKENGEKLLSSVFTVNVGNYETKWQLELLPNEKENGEDCISLNIIHMEPEEPYPWEELLTDVTFSIVNIKQECIQTPNGELDSAVEHDFCDDNTWGHHCFIKHTDLKELKNYFLPNDRLSLCCDLNISWAHPRIFSGFTKRVDLTSEDVEDYLVENLRFLLDSKLLSDVTIIVDEQEFPAHKAFLAARSTVFAAMFQNKMKESEENVVKIDDMTPEAFKVVLEYIYTGKTTNMNNNQLVKNVLYAANKYALHALKKMCEIKLCNTINVENAAELLIMAEMHDGKVLKEHALQFVISNSTEVIESEGWRCLEEHHPKLAIEVLRAYALSTKTLSKETEK